MDAAPVTMIIRTLNSQATLSAAIASIRTQSVAAVVLVVDSGSTDDTLELARDQADRVVSIRPEEFSYGNALNVGCRVASTPVVGALSSHSELPRPDWLAIGMAHLDAGAVGACGGTVDGEHRPLLGPLNAGVDYLRAHPYWGFTNTASLWRSAVWEQEPFDATLVATEDQEWSWRAVTTAPDGHIVVDPRLAVSGSHRRRAGLRAYHQRMLREIRALEHIRPLAPYSLGNAVADWGRAVPRDPFISQAPRLRRTRLLNAAARWSAGRDARRTPQPRLSPESGGAGVHHL